MKALVLALAVALSTYFFAVPASAEFRMLLSGPVEDQYGAKVGSHNFYLYDSVDGRVWFCLGPTKSRNHDKKMKKGGYCTLISEKQKN